MGATVAGEYRLLIGGEWVDGGAGSYDIVNPATEEVVGQAPEATASDAEAAAAAAAAALPGWMATAPEERARLLQAVGDELTKRMPDLVPLIIAETGSTISVGGGLQITQAIARFQRYSWGAMQQFQTIPLPPSVMQATALAAGALMGGVAIRQPVGVVTCISPYNFPLTNMAGKIAPALAAGNTIVMKPAPQDPFAVIELAKIIDEVGFPPGVVNIVTGSTPDTGAALVDSKNVDMISFTGSTAVGSRIVEAGAKTMKRNLMELGGKGACLVLQDADVAKVVPCLASVWGFHSGQICTAPTRAIVHTSKVDEVVSKLAATAPMLKVGDPLRADTVVGPIISAAQKGRIESMIASGATDGGELVVDGRDPDGEGTDRGFYVGPTLITGCNNQMHVVREEVFGPVIVVVPFEDEEEALAIANDSDYGLYGYVFSEDTGRAYELAKRMRCGNVGINTAQRNHEAPFGGFKLSGIGRDGGDFGVYAYTELQSIVWPG